MTELIFSTIAGSHLYGWAHENSDKDIYRVTTATTTKAQHTMRGDLDVVTVGLDTFLARAMTGSHQAVEALFSHKKVWYNDKYREMLENTLVTGREVFEKYERTIHKFCYGDFKKRRHACRLSLNLQSLRECGKFNPEVSGTGTKLSEAYANTYGGDELWALLV